MKEIQGESTLVRVKGAPNGSVPQNICSAGKFLLAGK